MFNFIKAVWNSFRCAGVTIHFLGYGHSCRVLAKVEVSFSTVQHLSQKVLKLVVGEILVVICSILQMWLQLLLV